MGQRPRSSSAQWFLLRIPTGFFPRVGWCCSHLSLDCLEGPPHGCFSSSLCDSLQWLLPEPEPRAAEENSTESTGPHTLVCKVTYHHCCHFLLLRVKLQSLTTINKEDCALDGVTGGRLRTWLPPHPSLK